MMQIMKARFIAAAVALLGLLMPTLAMAAENDEVIYNPRLTGFKQNMSAGDASTALTWLLLIFLALVCVSVMFKNAKRSHLD